MPLPKDMPIRDPKRAETDKKHATTYKASQGGYYPDKDKPVPGTPKP
ncbi:hypothetical protein ACIRJS_32980 [Streptomyces sp. NPDC102340]